MPVLVTVSVQDSRWRDALPRARSLAVQAVTAALAREGWARRSVAVHVVLASDATVRRLNRNWRGKDKPTNVLSFPVEEPGMKIPRGRPRQLGDIVLARQTLLREAREEGKKPSWHYQHLLVHGTLHLLGYDHMVDAEAVLMEARETAILAGLEVPDPYAPARSTKSAQMLG